MNEQELLELNDKIEADKFLPKKSAEIDNGAKKKAAWIIWLNKSACVFFGMGTWLPIHFVFSQMPYLIQTAPELWSLPSHVVIVIQLGNIIPLFYYLNKRRLILYETTLIFATFIVNIICLIALAFTFDIVVFINGNPHSLFLCIFLFFLASGGCVSVLLFLPYMSRLKKEYLVPFFIGEGADASVPGLLALFQGVTSIGNCPSSSTMVFSTKFFFLLGAFFVFLSTISFLYLTKQVETKAPKDECKSARESKNTTQRSYFVLLLALQASFSFFQYGIVSGLQSYSCLPYRYGKLVYQVTVNVNQFLGGIAVYLISLTKLKSTRRVLVMSALQMCIISYGITTAFMSPTPPMVQSLIGSVHIVFVWIISNITAFYTRLSIAAILRERSPKHLYYYGAATQAGAALGALCSFIVINYTNLLHSMQMESCAH